MVFSSFTILTSVSLVTIGSRVSLRSGHPALDKRIAPFGKDVVIKSVFEFIMPVWLEDTATASPTNA